MDPVIEACQNKYLDQLRLLFRESTDSERCVDICVNNNFYEGLNFILENISTCNGGLFTPMRMAMRNNYIECVRVFLDHGYNPSDSIYPPLFSLLSVQMAELLLSYDNLSIDINVVTDINYGGECCLFEILCYRLINYHYNVDHEKYKIWKTSTIYAVSESGALILNSDAQLILFLMEHGLKARTQTLVREYLSKTISIRNYEALEFFVDQLHFDITILNPNGQNLLFDAILCQNIKGVTFLLERGLQNTPDNIGRTPIEYALTKDSNALHTKEMVKLINLYDMPIKDPGID